MNQEKAVIIQLTRQKDDIFTGTFSVFWSQHPCHSCRTQLGSVVGQPAKSEGTRRHRSAVPCTCTSAASVLFVGCRQRTLQRHWARLHKEPAGLLQLLVVWAANFHPQQTPAHPESCYSGCDLDSEVRHNHACALGAALFTGVPCSPSSSNCSCSPTRPCTGSPPMYLFELAVRYRPGRTLRSADNPTRLAEPRTRGKYAGVEVSPSPVPPCGIICLAT